jgi:NAD(P)-dependent dehydrogenase (short-subunit alcohol dehydrogenase family)
VPRYDLAGRVALVTGGVRGIGFATAQALRARGATVAVVDLDREAAERAAADVDPANALGLAADVTDRGAMQRVVAEIVERRGGLDVVVANAGIAPRVATFRAMATETFDRVVDVNQHGVVNTVQAALPEIIRRRGHVVVIASIYSFVNGVGVSPYAMSKAAVEQFGRALRVELAPHGASASVAYFGFIDTEMVRRSVDGDPAAAGMLDLVPAILTKRLQPAAAGEAIAQGIERRAPRIVRPRSWVPVSALRGVLNPVLDARMRRDPRTLDAVRTVDAREHEAQPTTA